MTSLDNIPKRLKLARKANGFKTAKKFASEFVIPLSTYSQHENGKRSLNIENLINYAQKLKVTPCWLLTGQGYPCESESDETLEKRILEIQVESKEEICSNEVPLISFQRKYSLLEISLLKKIMQEFIPFYKKLPDYRMLDAIDFCFELYNRVVLINGSEEERTKLIRICLDSFLIGLKILYPNELDEKISLAG